MSHRLLILLGVMLLLRTAHAAPPNIVFILADDLGWTDLGCMGSNYYQTPHIDRLRAEGLSFSAFYVNPNCAPTRAAFISGQYAPRTGVYTVGTLARGRDADRKMSVPANRRVLPLDKVTVANAMKQAGYVTGMFGKWHLGTKGDYHPGRRGFDEAVQSNGRHFKFRTNPRTEFAEDAYLADHLTDLSLQFIETHRDKRFFLFLSHFAVHSPYHAKASLIERFKPGDGGHRDPTYAAMITSVDESVGRVMKRLDELGLGKNTVLIFSSDNGGVGGYYTTERPSKRRGITDNHPLRGGKGTLYEGGVRVPFLVRWPAVTPPGSSCDTPGVHVDLFPTFVDLAGGTPPGDYPLDGISLAPLFRNPEARIERNDIFWHFPGYLESYVHRPAGWRTTPVSVIRSGDFKLMEFLQDGRLELYNIREDLSEKQDLADEEPEIRKRLHGKLVSWRESLRAEMPVARD